MAQVRPEDDYFHRRPLDDPYWNESAWFPFHHPERDLSGFFYMSHRPNMGFSMTGFALWDPSGEETYDSVYHDWGEFTPLDRGYEMFDYRTPNGVSVACVEPLKSFTLGYDRDGVTADLRFQATMDPFCDPERAEPRHYEQGGRITGTIHVHGEDIEIDCGSNRDRSWGPRHHSQNPRGDFPWFNDGRGTAFQMYAMGGLASESDPVHGTTEAMVTGWNQADGKEAALVFGSRQVVERRPDGVPLRLLIKGEDELGRRVRAEGRTRNVLRWVGWARYFQFWQLCEWTLDSGQKCFGEAVEWFPGGQARRFLRAQRDRAQVGVR